jgi:hypothetical protein
MVIPVVSGEFKEYPVEEGPYDVFIYGKSYGGAVADPIFWDVVIGFQLGSFCRFNFPYGPEFNMLNGSIFTVNGNSQNVDYPFPAQIGLKGFRGLAPNTVQLNLKILSNGRILIFGKCDLIYLWYGLN